MTIGVGILGVGGWSLDRTLESGGKPLSPLVTWLVIGAGALMVSLGRGLPDGHWTLIVTPVIIIGAGFILRYWIDSPVRHLLGPLLAITASGIWATAPDAESARVLLGASLPLSLVTLSGIDARLTSAGSFAVAGTVAWIGASGGAERPSAADRRLDLFGCVGCSANHRSRPAATVSLASRDRADHSRIRVGEGLRSLRVHLGHRDSGGGERCGDLERSAVHRSGGGRCRRSGLAGSRWPANRVRRPRSPSPGHLCRYV